MWFRFLIKQKILSRNLILATLISNFSQKLVLISVRSLKFLTISEFIFEIPWVYISLKLLCMNLRSGFDLWNIVAYLKSLESLKSFLIFRVTFDGESHLHLWMSIWFAVPSCVWIYLFLRSYLPSLNLLRTFKLFFISEVAFYLWNIVVCEVTFDLWSHFWCQNNF